MLTNVQVHTKRRAESIAKGAGVTRKQRREGWGLALPALLIIAAITIFPIIFSVYMSLNNVQLGTSGYIYNWVGLQNYVTVLRNSMFQHALWFTSFYTVVTVFSELVLGFLVALVLDKLVHGRGVMLTILLIPWSLITVVSAEIWGYIYNGVYGVLNAIVMGLHLSSEPHLWLGTPILAVICMMISDIWKTTPFVAIVLLAGLQMINRDVYEAAEIDGASGWKSFWKVTLPLMRPTIGIAVLFRILQAFGLFDLPYVLTNGGPGTSTQSLAMLGYKVMFGDLHFGTGAAVASTTSIVVLIVALIFLKVFRSQVGEEDV